MPELPEVTTTVNGLKRVLKERSIVDIWTDLGIKKVSLAHHKDTLKDESFFSLFKKKVTGVKVSSLERRGKNILINLANGETILIHMKMTGHIMYGLYAYDKKTNQWAPDPEEKNEALKDPFNKFLHVVFTLDNGKHIVLSDMRKFAKVTILPTKELFQSSHLGNLGPEPLERNFTFPKFKSRLLTRPKGNIKTVLMDQSVIAGIGNIYSDEMLWLAGIHPESKPGRVSEAKLKVLYGAMKDVLKKGVDFGGDSTSDYRDISGNRGKFQGHHNAYQKTKKPCGKIGCRGVILRKVINGRSAHFCDTHQIIFT
jgi:formamidopyrimidine-DNA glycosylase